MKRILCVSFAAMLMLCAWVVSADVLELSLYMGMKDGSENSDGVTLVFEVEEQDGDVVEGRGGCGQVLGLVHSVVSVKELIDGMIEDARTLRKRLDSMLPAD